MDRKERITIEKLREQLFGKVWETVLASGLPAGSFLLDDTERLAVCDGSALELMGLPTDEPMSVDYDSAKGILNRLNELRNDGLPLDLTFLQDMPEGFTSAIVTLNELAFRNSTLNSRLLTQSELFAVLGQQSKRPLLLIKILGTEGSSAEQAYCLSSAVGAIVDTLPEGALVSQRSKDELWVLLTEDTSSPLETAKEMRLAVEGCKLRNDLGILISEHHYMSLMTGICEDDMLPSYKMHAATVALYQTMANGKAGEEAFRQENYTRRDNEYGDMVKFSKLLDQNLFVYHFQPIVSARTGDIVAYEALMRTQSEIGLNPLEILELAARYGRLYDIELATVKNTLAVLSANQSYFEERNLFINAISSHLLTEEDFTDIKNSYGELLEKVVVELTEQSELDDDSLNYTLGRIHSANMQLAIDDYGTGYSNTSNLLRYRPQVVKLDRSLIANIDCNPRMQKLVAGIIEFLHSSGMLALGEGVETLEEIRTLINMGVDLLQGYYVSRPKPVLVNNISEDVKQQIVVINLEASGLVKKVYHAADGEAVDMQELALERFTDIYIEGGKVELIGNPESLIRMPVAINDGAECRLTLKDVGIETIDEEPAISLGKDCRVDLVCENCNRLYHSGIYVPESSSLTVSGIGTLTISPEAHDSYAIGNTPIAACGDITISMDGHLILNVNGENAVGIGAGQTGQIAITAGKTELNCTNANCVGIGSWNSETDICIRNCEVIVNLAAGTAVGIGSMNGYSRMECHDTSIKCFGSGNRLCGVGTMENGHTDIKLRNLKLNAELKGKNVTCIGTYNGITDCDIKHASVHLYAEGGRVSGVGDMAGGGSIDIDESELEITFLSGESMTIGSKNGPLRMGSVLKKISIND